MGSGLAFVFPTWFEPVGTVGNPVGSDGVEALFIEMVATRERSTQNCNHRLERFECLNGSFETDRSGLDAVFAGRLCDDGPDEIVGEDVCPDFLSHQLGCLAAQDFHLHSLLRRSQIEFDLSVILPPKRTFYQGRRTIEVEFVQFGSWIGRF